MSGHALIKTATLLALALGLAACSKLTAENYAKLETGMSYTEVATLLGTPERCDDMAGFKSCRWGDDKQNITVRFVADKLALHSAENIR